MYLKKKRVNNLKKIFFLIKDYKIKVYFMLFLIGIGSILELASLGILIPVISYFSGNEFLYLKNFFYFNSENYIFFLLFFILIIFSFKTFFFVYLNIYKNKLLANLSANIGKELFSFYIKKNYLFHLRNSSPKLISNIEETISTISQVISASFNFLIDLCIISIIVFFLLNINFIFTILLLLCLLFVSFFYYSIIKNYLKALGESKFFFRSLKTRFLQESFSGIRDIKLLNNYNYAIDGFYNSNLKLLKIISKDVTLQSFPRLLFELLIVFLFVILILFLLHIKTDYSYIAFLLGIFLVCAVRILPIAGRLLSSLQILRVGIKCLNTVYDDLKAYSDIKKNEKSYNVLFNSNFFFKNNIKFENVDFAYQQERSELILNDVSILINKGDIIAITGDSGSGKSTLLDLFCGLLNPTRGKILIDNKNLISNEKSWQSKVSYISQNIFLNEATILENITFSNKKDQIDNILLDKVLIVSGLNNLINKLPMGIETHIGEKGLKLSGGQKQRVGIARCLYKNSEVLIFDEATNALSLNSEKEIINLVKEFYRGKTLIFTSHRKETLEFCNTILKLENKKVVKII